MSYWESRKKIVSKLEFNAFSQQRLCQGFVTNSVPEFSREREKDRSLS